MHKSNGKFLNEDFDLKVYTDSPRCISPIKEMSSHIKLFNLVPFCNVLAEVVHTVFLGGINFYGEKKNKGRKC